MKRSELVDLFSSMANEIAERNLGPLNEEIIIADLGLDSLAILELVGGLERELKIHVTDEELSDVQTLGQLVDVIEHKLKASGS